MTWLQFNVGANRFQGTRLRLRSRGRSRVNKSAPRPWNKPMLRFTFPSSRRQQRLRARGPARGCISADPNRLRPYHPVNLSPPYAPDDFLTSDQFNYGNRRDELWHYRLARRAYSPPLLLSSSCLCPWEESSMPRVSQPAAWVPPMVSRAASHLAPLENV